MKYIIKAPNKNYNGTSATVSFRDGTGNTDSEHLAEWFRKHGYDVIESEREPAPLDSKTRTKKKEAENPKEE